MNPDVPYFEDGTTRVLRYLRENLGSSFKAYLEGDPVAIPMSLMPCICVAKLSGDTEPSATGTNDITERILIKVVLNKNDDLGANLSEPNVDLTQRKLRTIVAGRDKATANFLPDSIFGVLTTNFTLGNQVLSMNLSDEYGLDQRPNPESAESVITAEAYITLELNMRVIVIPRS